MSEICRLAPSPTGRMHAGNVFSSLISWLIARQGGGEVVLRMEDLDVQRSKQEYIDQVQRDYELLGITWDRGPFFQASNSQSYQRAFEDLLNKGIIYPCFCSRSDLLASSAPQGDCGPVYAGTCRTLTKSEQDLKLQGLQESGKTGPSYRVMVPRGTLSICDRVYGQRIYDLQTDCGDFIVRRSDGLFAYQLAVVVDDCNQGVTTVVRGNDLLSSSCRQRFLQDMLSMPHCEYAHVPLLVAEDGRRLAKRDRDAHLDELLFRYKTPERILGRIAYLTGLVEEDASVTADELIREFDFDKCKAQWSKTGAIIWKDG